MAKFIIIFLLLFFTIQNMQASDFDSSIDGEIRKQYNVNELPALPKVSPSKNNSLPQEIKKYNFTGKSYTIKAGTKLTIISKNEISSWKNIGSKISFILNNPITTKEGTIIPSGTILKATVINSHRPQITGNGGLIQFKVNEIYYNGVMSIIDTKLSEANYRHVFGNKIKGKRKYWKNCSKAMNPGKKTFKLMKNAAKDISSIPIINILSVVPFAVGSTVYLVNASISPIISLFMKGENIKLPAGTTFVIIIKGNNIINV